MLPNQCTNRVLMNVFFCSLKGVRHLVWQARANSPLFDTARYAKDLERLFYKMWERVANGLEVDHVTELSVI